MVDYIEREAATNAPVLPKDSRQYQSFNLDDAYEQGWSDALENLKNIPTADVAPVVHSKWILDTKNHCFCSQCSHGRNIEMQIGWNYCPNCGAKMDLEG